MVSRMIYDFLYEKARPFHGRGVSDESMTMTFGELFDSAEKFGRKLRKSSVYSAALSLIPRRRFFLAFSPERLPYRCLSDMDTDTQRRSLTVSDLEKLLLMMV